jgi:NADPH2:quinone reductase
LRRASDLFAWMQAGKLKLRIEKSLPLQDASEAQQLLEKRRTTGKLILVP